MLRMDQVHVIRHKVLQASASTERHFKDEYSTYDWVMDGLRSRAGFAIKHKHMDGGVLATYVCTRG